MSFALSIDRFRTTDR